MMIAGPIAFACGLLALVPVREPDDSKAEEEDDEEG